MRAVAIFLAQGLFASTAVHAADATPPIAPQPPAICDEAAYVPGTDARGRSVTPADLPHNGTVSVGTVVVPKIRTPQNRQIGDVEVAVELEGLNRAFNPQPCLSSTSKPAPPVHVR